MDIDAITRIPTQSYYKPHLSGNESFLPCNTITNDQLCMKVAEDTGLPFEDVKEVIDAAKGNVLRRVMKLIASGAANVGEDGEIEMNFNDLFSGLFGNDKNNNKKK